MPKHKVREQIKLDWCIGNMIAQSRLAQNDQYSEYKEGGIKSSESVKKEPCQIEKWLLLPTPMPVAERDDISAKREEDGHTDT
jgi:hypothetical protein